MIKKILICDKCNKECDELFGAGSLDSKNESFKIFYTKAGDFGYQLTTELCKECYDEFCEEMRHIIEKYKLRKEKEKVDFFE